MSITTTKCVQCGEVIYCNWEERHDKWVCGTCAKSPVAVRTSTLETNLRTK